MFYGDTIQLREKPNIKQPCGFFVFDDGIVAIRPPQGSFTIGMNEANNVQTMTVVCIHGITLVKKRPSIAAEVFALSMSIIDDHAGRPMQIEVIAMSDITSAELAKSGLLGAKVTVKIKGKSKALVLNGNKKAVKEFAGFLTKPLGDRFTSSLK